MGRKSLFFIWFFCFSGNLLAQENQIISIKEIPEEGILLDKGWKYKVGDNPEYASPDFDDSTWDTINPVKDIHNIPPLWKDSVVWFRIHMVIDSARVGNLAFTLMQSGASEFYLNGKLFRRFGIIGDIPKETVAVNPSEKPYGFPVNKSGLQVLAIRYQLEPGIPYSTKWVHQNLGIEIKINSVENANSYYNGTRIYDQLNIAFRASSYIVLSILFLTFYVSDRKRKTNLYFFVYAVLLAIVWSLFIIGSGVFTTVRLYYYWASFVLVIQIVGYIYFLTAIYDLLGHEKQKIFYVIVIFGICCIPLGMLVYPWGWLVFAMGFISITNFEIARVAFLGFLRKKRGAFILAVGGVICFGFWLLFLLFNYTPISPFLNQWFAFSLSLLTMPVAVLIFIGYDFAKTNQTLEYKLIEVKELSEEKTQILTDQKEILEKEVAERTHDLQASLENLRSTQAQLIQSEKIATLVQKTEALRLKELDLVKTKLYTNITHEFRTPLTVILGVANQVLENPKEHLSNRLKIIMRNGQNLLTLVNQMLDLSKLESGKLSLQNHNGDIVSFLGYIIDSFHSLAENKGIQIHFISVKDQLNMDFDEVRLQQIVSNIISNSLKFTPKGGHVYISTDFKNDSFILKIKDTGIGIAESDLPHIFDRFYQADDSHTRHGEGTGIGLALTQELVKLMKGAIAVKSKEGQGSEFEVIIPIGNISGSKEAKNLDLLESLDSISEIVHPILDDVVSQPTLVKPVFNENGFAHVLVADDNEDVLAFVLSCLENEFVVEVAKNGQECEELAFNTTPDLIVMDVMMPFKDGFEVCKSLKTDERTSHIPIVMLTAKADLESRLQGLGQGADDYLTKPFHKKELLLRIKNLLDLRRQLQQYYRKSLEDGLSANSLQNPNSSNNGSSVNSVFKGTNDLQTGIQNPSIPIASSLENAFVIKVRKTIETHLEEPDFDVEKLCRFLALSHSQIHRKLSALTGLSATHFIRYVRLVKAKELIIKSGFSIAAIAYDCGFNDPAYFSRIFKQEFGISPQVWREQNSV